MVDAYACGVLLSWTTKSGSILVVGYFIRSQYARFVRGFFAIAPVRRRRG